MSTSSLCLSNRVFSLTFPLCPFLFPFFSLTLSLLFVASTIITKEPLEQPLWWHETKDNHLFWRVRRYFHYCVQSHVWIWVCKCVQLHVWRWVINMQTIENMVVGENSNVTEGVCLCLRTEVEGFMDKDPFLSPSLCIFFFFSDLGFSLFRWVL